MSSRKRKVRKGVPVLFAVIIVALIGVTAVAALHLKGNAKPAGKTVTSQNAPSKDASGSQSTAPSKISTGTGSLLMLASKTSKLPENYVPNFTKVPGSYYYTTAKDTRFDIRAAKYLEEFIDAGRKAGFDLYVLSGYRTYAYQKNNLDRHIKAFEAKGETSSQAYNDAAAIVAPPGTSEHETGLAADIISKKWYSSSSDGLTAAFDTTAAFKWMDENCAKYGFILRYTKDKVAQTGYSYEPWHYRFVGADNAKKIMSEGICLEEYLKNIKS